MKPASEERFVPRRSPNGLAVDAADDQLAQAAVGEEASAIRRPLRPRRPDRRTPGRVWSELPPRSRYSAARPSTRTTAAPAARWKRPSIGLAAARPRDRGAIRVRRIRGREHVDGRRVAVRAGQVRGRRAVARARRRARTARHRARPRSSRAGSGPLPPGRGASGRPRRSRPRGPRPSPTRGRGRRGGRAARARAGAAARWGSGAAPAASHSPLPTSDQRPAASGGPRDVSRPTRPRAEVRARAASSAGRGAARRCRS